MPAAVRIAAEVMTGGDTKALNKMMEAGNLDPNELLPKMAAYMEKMANANGAYAKALGTSIVAQGRMNFQFERFVGIFSDAGGEQGFYKIFNTIAKFFKDNPKMAMSLGRAWETVGKIFERVGDGVSNLAIAFDMIADKLNISTDNLGLMGVVAGSLMTKWGRLLGVMTAIFIVFEDIAVGMAGGDSYTKRFLDFLNDNSWAEFAVKTAGTVGALTIIASKILDIGKGLGLISANKNALVGALNIAKGHPVIAALTTLASIIAMLNETSAAEEASVSARNSNIARSRRQRNLGGALFDSPEGQMGAIKSWYESQLAKPKDHYTGRNRGGNPVSIQKIEITVNGTANAEETANIVFGRMQKMIHESMPADLD